jgi:hypothetical protein
MPLAQSPLRSEHDRHETEPLNGIATDQIAVTQLSRLSRQQYSARHGEARPHFTY